MSHITDDTIPIFNEDTIGLGDKSYKNKATHSSTTLIFIYIYIYLSLTHQKPSIPTIHFNTIHTYSAERSKPNKSVVGGVVGSIVIATTTADVNDSDVVVKIDGSISNQLLLQKIYTTLSEFTFHFEYFKSRSLILSMLTFSSFNQSIYCTTSYSPNSASSLLTTACGTTSSKSTIN
ncbi:hypothetical protein PPL_00927 [Heterostelium album PN500]|uniref:Uncharacterized protein n=1 Tax=Heterostelium pallidum (strain ATCC 26659 / Pp 5 / PN500) TaxID=670386 RepID=D3AXM1_HETP5|nr:hypothetical protein PPL_00927 [Heterostelium album PN500]EFA85698.1 hypothetical protein PPL_00927 [Heterostelium album PN500]|eukprot:XP_020437804.1 hypothetical protein PPL_00927 [Heterostelium album PN500]